VLEAAQQARVVPREAAEVSERPGEGLRGTIGAHKVQVTSRKKLIQQLPESSAALPEAAAGLECVVMVDGRFAGLLRFRDEPRAEGSMFIRHLTAKHRFGRVMLVSGDRESEVRYLAEKVGIREVHFSQSPEQKVELVRREAQHAPTIFMGDGINDAPALA